MNKKGSFVSIYILIWIAVYLSTQIKFGSIFTMVAAGLFTTCLIFIYLKGNNKINKRLIAFSVLSSLLFMSYLYYLTIPVTQPNNFGDFSLLPIILFIVSVPAFVMTHTLITVHVWTTES